MGFSTQSAAPRTPGSGGSEPRPRVGVVDPAPRDPGRRPAPLPISPALRTRQATQLRARLQRLLPPLTLRVTVTSNRSVMISVTRDPKHREYAVRVHHIFAEAPDPVVADLARYIVQNDPESSAALGAYIDGHPDGGRGKPPPRVAPRLNDQGKFHNLSRYFDELNRDYFGGRVRCKLTWGRNAARGRRRHTINVGSYTVEDDIIRLHPGLDQEWVPDYYVKWVLYHEMLHAVQPLQTVGGRHRFHTPEFEAAEQRYADHPRASAWEKRNLALLLCI